MRFTKTEQLIINALADGRGHRKQVVLDYLRQHYDSLMDLGAMQVHLTRMRKKMRPIGEDIVCVYHRNGSQYQHVRLLASAYDGRK